MRQFILVLILAVLPLAGFAKKPEAALPTDEAGLRALAGKGNAEAMYELGRMCDDVELIMDLESIKVTPSPGAKRTREAYYWYGKAEKKGLLDARYKMFAMHLYARPGVDLTDEKRKKEAYNAMVAPGKIHPNILYAAALIYYYGPDRFGYTIDDSGTMYPALIANGYAKDFLKRADPSHALYANAQVIFRATEQGAAEDRRANNEAGLKLIAASVAAGIENSGDFTSEGFIQSLQHSLTDPSPQPVPTAVPFQQARPVAPIPVAALAVPDAQTTVWLIKFDPEYSGRVAAQCNEMGILPPKYIETGYSEETFFSAADAWAWLHGKFSEGPLPDLYRAGKIGVPEQIPQ